MSRRLVSEAAMSPIWRFTLADGETRYRGIVQPCRWWDAVRVERMALSEVTAFVRAAVLVDGSADHPWPSEKHREAAVIGVMLGFPVRHAVAKAIGGPCCCVHCFVPLTCGAGDMINVSGFVEDCRYENV